MNLERKASVTSAVSTRHEGGVGRDCGVPLGVDEGLEEGVLYFQTLAVS